jgi:hypothetical protein
MRQLMMLMQLKKNKGSITIETTLIISVVLFILIAVVFSFMLMYQKALLTKIASTIAQQGAEIWVDSRKQIGNGYWSEAQEKDSIYYRIFDDSLITGKKYNITINNSAQLDELLSKTEDSGTLQDQKFTKMKIQIYKELGRGILKPSKTIVNIEFHNVLQRKIEISLTQSIKIPLGFLEKFIGKTGSIDLTSKGTAIVTEPAENIRNIDLGIEYSKTIGESVDLNSLMERLRKSK